MPVIQGQLSVAAGTTVANVVAGAQLRRIPLDSAAVIALADTGSAAGLTRSYSINNVVEVEDGAVGATNRLPFPNEDQVADAMVAGPGAEQNLRVSNPTGGALTYFYRLNIALVPPGSVS